MSSPSSGTTASPRPPPRPARGPARAVTLGILRDRYAAALGNGTVEANSLYTVKIHLAHACRVLGAGMAVGEMTLPKLQEYVNARAKAGVAPATSRKEVSTLRDAWNWGGLNRLTAGVFPNRGLRYPKADEKPPFMTRDEAVRRVAAGGDPAVLWDAAYLQADEVGRLLVRVGATADLP